MDESLKKTLREKDEKLTRVHGFVLSISSVDAFLRLVAGEVMYRGFRLQYGVASGMTACIEGMTTAALVALAAGAPAPRGTAAHVESVVCPLFGVPPGHREAVPPAWQRARPFPIDGEGKPAGDMGDGIRAIAVALSLDAAPSPLVLDAGAITTLSDLVLLKAATIFKKAILYTEGLRRKTVFRHDLRTALLHAPTGLAAGVAHAMRHDADMAMCLGGTTYRYSSYGTLLCKGERPPGRTRSQKAGLVLSVNTAEKLLRGFKSKCVGSGAPVYLAATMEYLMAELIELTDREAQEDVDGSAEAAVQLEPKHALRAIYSDVELKAVLFTNTGIAFTSTTTRKFHGLLAAINTIQYAAAEAAPAPTARRPPGDGTPPADGDLPDDADDADDSAGDAGAGAAGGGAARETDDDDDDSEEDPSVPVDIDGRPDRLAEAVDAVAQQVCPDATVSPATRSLIAALVEIVAAQIARVAWSMTTSNGKKTLSSREVQGAVRLCLCSDVGNELAKHAVSEGTKAVTKYSCYY